MGKEIERKFLINDSSYKELAESSIRIRQGYLNRDPDRTVRVRIIGDKACITIKGRNHGAVRDEWEFEIDPVKAVEMLPLCEGGIIDKTRYYVGASDGLCWEVDEFHGRLAPLVVAEIELPSPETEFTRPGFVGKEVTDNPAYFNSSLSAQA